MGTFAIAAFVLCVAVLAPLLLAPSLRRSSAPVAADAGTDVAPGPGTRTSDLVDYIRHWFEAKHQLAT